MTPSFFSQVSRLHAFVKCSNSFQSSSLFRRRRRRHHHHRPPGGHGGRTTRYIQPRFSLATGASPKIFLLSPPPLRPVWSATQTRATYGGLCGMPACGQAVGCGVCDMPELWRGPAGLCARVRACHDPRRQYVHACIHTTLAARIGDFSPPKSKPLLGRVCYCYPRVALGSASLCLCCVALG